MVRAAFGDRHAGLPLTYVTQTDQRGTADAVAAARESVSGEFLVVNGDDYYAAENVAALAGQAGAAVLGAPAEASGRFGVLRADAGLLVRIDEKPEEGGAALVNTGLYKVDETIFEYIDRLAPSPRGELEFTGALANYAADRPVAVVAAPAPWLPIATAHDLLAAQLKLWPLEEATFLGGGDCRLDADATVGGRSVLGCGCDIGARAVVEASLLLDGVSVGAGAAVAGSALGEGVAVDEEAVVDGAVLGDGAHVGTAARLEAGSRIWPNVKIDAGAVVAGDVQA
jgi:NDP-sugar pyrophosphorylase family protein